MYWITINHLANHRPLNPIQILNWQQVKKNNAPIGIALNPLNLHESKFLYIFFTAYILLLRLLHDGY
jgi:hypothetical protein